MQDRHARRDMQSFERIARYLVALPASRKRTISRIADVIALALAFCAALALKFEQAEVVFRIESLVASLSALVIFSALGLYRSLIRFMGPKPVFAMLTGVTASAFAVAAFDRFDGTGDVPAAALVIYWALALLYVFASRFAVRYLRPRARHQKPPVRVAIYGAGDAGARLCSVLLGGPDFDPVAFVDDDKSRHGNRINGITVYDAKLLPELVAQHRIERLLLAMPSISRRRRREILSSLEPLGIHVQSLPDLGDIISGKAHIEDLREVDVGDLLGRDAVPPNPQLFESCIRGRSVMVTGAGGSIGSELCRQILQVSPRRLVLFEMSELALYTIQRELDEINLQQKLGVEIVPLLGNAHHRSRVREVLSVCSVQTLYHAAAYKHVPIVEHNVVEGVHNNVIGTWYTAEAALESGVETFVLVSTDKAVNPTNVMGATKRMAELVLQALQARSHTTRFCMVRFGNVLASSGSVVPLFQEQIRRGGPVTVTHPDVIRYFMTITEAAQLVIQAGSMGKGGDVFVLDMGRPVRIDDLARRLISLTGLSIRDATNPDGDIEILYTGLRTGEKLFEELLIGTNVEGTEHPMILRAIEHSLPWSRMQQLLDELLASLVNFDCRRTLALLSESVAEYDAKHGINDYVWTRKASAASAEASKIADFVAKRRQAEPGKPTLGG